MTALVVSDLHLGMASERDLARRPDLRAPLLARAAQAERVVLLGDILELRDGPVAGVLAAATPFFRDLGEAIAGRQLVVVPGNHDHQLAVPLLDRQSLRTERRWSDLEARVEPERDGLLGALATLMPGVDVRASYPGVWIRPDVYATHGHYLDLHMTVPKLESLAVSAAALVAGKPPETCALPADYEAALAPVYSLAYGMAQSARRRAPRMGPGVSLRMWQRLNGNAGSRRSALEAAALRKVLVPATVGVLNRAGLGPFRSDLSGRELHRAGLAAMREVARRLGLSAAHLVFGHTHRSGPLAGEGEWSGPPALVNSGTWVWERGLVGGRGTDSPYWPGTVVAVEGSGPPRVERLLESGPDGSPASPAG